MACERTGIDAPSGTHEPAAAAFTTRPGTVNCAMPVRSTLVSRAINSAAAETDVIAAIVSSTACTANAAAQFALPVVAVAVAPFNNKPVTRSSPNIAFTSCSGKVLLMRLRACAAAARNRYVAGRGARPRSSGDKENGLLIGRTSG